MNPGTILAKYKTAKTSKGTESKYKFRNVLILSSRTNRNKS